MIGRIFSIVLPALCAALPLRAQEPTDWYPATVENRPFVRWWWLGSAVDEQGLTHNLEAFAGKGLGGVEITPIYGVRGNERADIDYLSPRWMEVLRHTLCEGDRLGLRIDMNNGTGWPFGGPDVTPEYSARKRIVRQWMLSGGERLTEKIRPEDPRQQAVATLQYVLAFDGTHRLDLTSRVDADTLLRWCAPEGRWRIYALFSGRTFQKVKRAAPGGEGLVINHYDSTALLHYLDRFDRAFSAADVPWPNTLFNDSFEVYGSDWDDRLPEEFERRNGYRLEMYLPEFESTEPSELRARVLCDYRRTLAAMLLENFTRPWSRWAHARGIRVRNQAHGSPGNILDLYAAVDIPECESFGQTDFDIPGLHRSGPVRPSDADPAVLKFASSAAHLTGKAHTSAEALTWLTEHFHTTLARCKPEIDQLFCSGVNRLYFHGAPYSPPGAAFPGWLFYAAVNLSPTASLWRDAGALFDYVTRCQAFLAAGEPDNDFLIYLPLYDIWEARQERPCLMLDIHRMDHTMPDLKRAVGEVLRAGYDADYISDRYLSSLQVDSDGSLRSEGGTRYRALILPSCRLMQPEALARIAELTRQGATAIFIGSLPDDVPGLSRLEPRRKALRRTLARLPRLPEFDTPAATPYGKGRIITGCDYAATLALTGIRPEPFRTEQGGSMIRRRNEAGGCNYFLALLRNRPVDGWVTLSAEAEAVELFDPVSGERGAARIRRNTDGTTGVRLQLEPGQSLLAKTFPRPIDMPPWPCYRTAGSPLAVDRGWEISFPESDPAIETHFATDTLTQWCALPDPRARINAATARYTAEFILDDPSTADEWLLDLGDVRESAAVRINGCEAGICWSVPFRIRIGRWLRAGVNRLEIDVTNLQANRIADYERRGVRWRIFKDANIASVTNARKFDFGAWPTAPSGLNSQVRIIPLRRDEIPEND